MKIAFIVESFPSPTETFILNQITGLIDLGHEVDIYAVKQNDLYGSSLEIEKYNLLSRTFYSTDYSARCPHTPLLRALKGLYLFFRYFSWNPAVLVKSLNFLQLGNYALSLRLLYWSIPFLKSPKYDIIQCHFGLIGLRASLLKQIGALHGKLVTSFHGVDMTMHIKMLGVTIYNPLFETGDLFLPVSNHWANKLIKLGCNPAKIKVHHMGVDSNKFRSLKDYWSMEGTIQCITVARLVEKKGLEYSINAIANLALNYPELKYYIVGDGPLRNKLEQLIRKLNIEKTVVLLGGKSHSETIQLVSESDIMLAPSITSTEGDQEGIPVSLMEAMAIGIPVVSTWHSGIPELVQNEISGLLVPEKDIEDLAEKVRYLIENPQVRQRMGIAGRSYVQAEFDIDRLNLRLVNTYQELLKAGKEICLV